MHHQPPSCNATQAIAVYKIASDLPKLARNTLPLEGRTLPISAVVLDPCLRSQPPENVA
ncbi:MAG: hypothetical protein WBA43_09605 [Elainellaceae cyanobacterium]